MAVKSITSDSDFAREGLVGGTKCADHQSEGSKEALGDVEGRFAIFVDAVAGSSKAKEPNHPGKYTPNLGSYLYES